MPSVTEQDILDILRPIEDPARGESLVALGMIGGVQVREGHVTFTIEVDAARAGEGKAAPALVDGLLLPLDTHAALFVGHASAFHESEQFVTTQA